MKARRYLAVVFPFCNCTSFSATSACGGLRVQVVAVVPNRSRSPVPSPLHRSGCHNSSTKPRACVPHLPATHPCGTNHCILVVRIVLSPGTIAAAGRSCSCTRPPTAYCVHDDCRKSESYSDNGAGVPVRVTVALQQVLRKRTLVSPLGCWSRSRRRSRHLYHIITVA